MSWRERKRLARFLGTKNFVSASTIIEVSGDFDTTSHTDTCVCMDCVLAREYEEWHNGGIQ